MDVQTLAVGEMKGRQKVQITSNAQAVLSARYLSKDREGNAIETPEDLFARVASAIAAAEKNYGLSDSAVETVRDEFYDMMASGRFMPNSPTLMNAGRTMGMLSACFVLPVEDSIDGIFRSVRHAAMIQKAGGGTGFSFSRLRPAGDLVASSGGATSGPISFIKVFSEATNAIQQGAFRRGANMGIMRIDHPNIIEFINAKEDLTKLTNFNLSVGVDDGFMKQLREAPDAEHVVYNPRNGKPSKLRKEDGSCWRTVEVFDTIVNHAWKTGEPGMIFIDRINADNPTPHIGEIEATNPCGEQPLLPYESCNLGSINLIKCVKKQADGKKVFDYEAMSRTVHLATRFLDDVIDMNKYPIPEIEEIAKGNRKIGLGVMGFADVLYELGVPYCSKEGVTLGGEIMKAVNDQSHLASAKLAEERGVFLNWEGSVWEQKGVRMRNACTTTVAPTGTISIIANCSGGIEPLFSLVFFRNVLDGRKFTEVNQTFETVAKERGFYSEGLIRDVAEKGSVQGMVALPEDVRKTFVTARDIPPDWHIRMQAAFQKHCDSSISKTINFSNEAGEADVRKIFLMAHEHGCKGVTVYRDGCRENQPMSLSEKKIAKEADPVLTAIVRPIAIPDVMPAVKVKQMTPFGNMHVKIVVDPQTEREREVFAQLGKGGDVATSDLEAICRIMSLYLRVNGSLDDIITQLDGIGSSLSIPTKDGRVTSLADGLASALKKYRKAKDIAGIEALLLGRVDLNSVQKGIKSIRQASHGGQSASGAFKVKCPDCSGDIAFEEGCAVCHGCGYSRC
jgi:ribonucleoside-diphosphate reductase alpha chain